MNLAKMIERVFFPPAVAVAGGIILLAFLNWDPKDTTTVLSSFLSYWIIALIIREKLDDENRIYASGGAVAIPVFLLCVLFLSPSKEVIFAGTSYLLILIIVYLIRPNWKISAHTTAGMGVSTVLSLVDPVFLIVFSILPPIIWSRFKLRAHNLSQVLAGIGLGFMIPVVSTISLYATVF